MRYGDYLTTNKTFGNLSLEYYSRNRDKRLPLIITTDSLDQLDYIDSKFKPSKIFTPSNSDSWQALKIMSHSTNFVMANSTLSWWGGFLANKSGCQVTCPRPFYKDLRKDLDLTFENPGFKYSISDYD